MCNKLNKRPPTITHLTDGDITENIKYGIWNLYWNNERWEKILKQTVKFVHEQFQST